MSWDEAFADHYDEWASGMTADIPFYVELALEADTSGWDSWTSPVCSWKPSTAALRKSLLQTTAPSTSSSPGP